MHDLLFQVTTNKSFDETVAAVQTQTQVNGFRVLHVHDVQATLAEKGFNREPLKIIEVCNAKYADMALKIEVTVSLLMPCRINVYTENGQTVISTARPTSLVQMFDKPGLKDFGRDVDDVLVKIIEGSK